MEPVILSYKKLRRAIGYLAILLAFGCILGGYFFGGYGILPSISDYYFTNMQDFFSAVLMGVSLFLFSYYGYSILDRIVYVLSGVSCLGIALFPCYNKAYDLVGTFQINSKLADSLHTACATIFFLLLAFNSYFVFTKTDPKGVIQITPEKKKRNKIYKTCGIVIFSSLILLGLSMLFLNPLVIKTLRLIMIFEIVSLTAFGISWLVKGEAIFKDK